MKCTLYFIILFAGAFICVASTRALENYVCSIELQENEKTIVKIPLEISALCGRGYASKEIGMEANDYADIMRLSPKGRNAAGIDMAIAAKEKGALASSGAKFIGDKFSVRLKKSERDKFYSLDIYFYHAYLDSTELDNTPIMTPIIMEISNTVGIELGEKFVLGCLTSIERADGKNDKIIRKNIVITLNKK